MATEAVAAGERKQGALRRELRFWEAIALSIGIMAPTAAMALNGVAPAGLIARGRDAQRRPCRLEPAPLKEVAEWAERYRALWEGRLDRLDTYLRHLQAKEKAHARQHRRK